VHPHGDRLGRALVRSGHRVFGLRGDKVRYVAIASRSTLAHPRRLRGYLRAAGLR
jgi:hypothetical protein